MAHCYMATRRKRSVDSSVKAALYARVSSDDGRQTVENQVQQLRELATARRFSIFNVVTMTKALQHLAADGYTFDEALVSGVSPYQTEHINRFGRYGLERDRIPEPLDGVRILRMPLRHAGSAAADAKAAV